jgi:OOP family OmpA-OmpF porin
VNRAVLWALCLCVPMMAQAQTASPPELPSQQQIIEALKPPTGPRMRNLGIEVAPVTLDISVGFQLNSSKLDAKGRQALDALAGALKSPDLSGQKFRIEGHTDASGRAATNQQLSERRAHEVVDYLVSTHGIDRTSLEAVGKGQSEPLIADNPRDPRNRRVRVALKLE